MYRLPRNISRLLFMIGLLAGTGWSYDLEVRVDSLVLQSPVGTGQLSVQIINRVDNIAGFELYLTCSRPDLIAFVPAAGSGLAVESAGTLTSSWQYLEAITISGQPFDINIVGIADLPGPPTTAPIPPDSTERTLISVPFVVLPGADTIEEGVTIVVATTFNLFGFARSDGFLIGELNGLLDTSVVRVQNGSVLVTPCCIGLRGNVNCDLADRVDIADLTTLLDYLFSAPLPSLCCEAEANVDALGSVDIADLTFLIDHLFINNPSLPACP